MNPSHRKLFAAKTDENRQNELENPWKEKPPNPPSSFPPPVNNGVHSHSLLSFTVAFGLLLGILLGLLHCCRRRNNFPRRRRINPISSLASQENHEEIHDQVQLDENPIWFINTAGLKESEINSIPAFGYKKHEGVTEGTECSVCLSEFREDERLKLLPKCDHAFHVSCIDTWLRAHKNCPLCRAPIVVSSDAGAANDQSDRQNQVDGEGGGCENLSSRDLSESSSTVVVLVPNAADEAETAEPKNPKPKNGSRNKTMRSFSSPRLSSTKGHLLDMKTSSSFAGI